MHAIEPATALLIRRAQPADAEGLRQLLDRCSAQTRYRRFHGVVREFPARYLHDCLTDAAGSHEARVAEIVTPIPGGTRIVALASAGPVADEPMLRELGVLVEDEWQRHGIGRLVTDELVGHARAAGLAGLRLELCRSQPDLMRFVFGRFAVARTSSSGCDVTVDVDVTRPAAARAR